MVLFPIGSRFLLRCGSPDQKIRQGGVGLTSNFNIGRGSTLLHRSFSGEASRGFLSIKTLRGFLI